MSNEISDADLRAQLKSYGINAGPITGTTRSIYLKKLETVKQAEKTAAKEKPKEPAKNQRRSLNVSSTTREKDPPSNNSVIFETLPAPEPVKRPVATAKTDPVSLPHRSLNLPSAPRGRDNASDNSWKPSSISKPIEVTKNPKPAEPFNISSNDRRSMNFPTPYRKNESGLEDTWKKIRDTTYQGLKETAANFGLRDETKRDRNAGSTPITPSRYDNGNSNMSTSDWLRSRRQESKLTNYSTWAPNVSGSHRPRWWHLNANTSKLLLILFGSFLALLAVLYEVILNKNKVLIFAAVIFGAIYDTFHFVYNQLIIPALIISAVVGVILFTIWYRRYKTRKAAEEQQQVFDMVEKILTVLKKHYEECLGDNNRQPYIVVPHVRDMLIPVQKRKQLLPIWEKAVQYLNENESRVRTEHQIISGEEFMVWRWLQVAGSPVRMEERVWKGHAFPEEQASLNVPSEPMYDCLKLRGLFDPDFEMDEEEWPEHVQDAILEKLGSSIRVMHVAIDTESKEGCVYLKLGSKEEAATAFKILHGSWFDGRLVTVKYLRTERYHERFPESQRCHFPLRVKKPRHSLLG